MISLVATGELPRRSCLDGGGDGGVGGGVALGLGGDGAGLAEGVAGDGLDLRVDVVAVVEDRGELERGDAAAGLDLLDELRSGGRSTRLIQALEASRPPAMTSSVTLGAPAS